MTQMNNSSLMLSKQILPPFHNVSHSGIFHIHIDINEYRKCYNNLHCETEEVLSMADASMKQQAITNFSRTDASTKLSLRAINMRKLRGFKHLRNVPKKCKKKWH
jgi:hypothetical protein